MKFNCIDSNEDLVGVVEAPNAEEALKLAQKLNKNVREVSERPAVEREVREPKER